jgi:hypothetical protein
MERGPIMSLHDDTGRSDLEALQERLRRRMENEHLNHPFPEPQADRLARERQERWDEVLSETWHPYEPSPETRLRRQTELFRAGATVEPRAE